MVNVHCIKTELQIVVASSACDRLLSIIEWPIIITSEEMNTISVLWSTYTSRSNNLC